MITVRRARARKPIIAGQLSEYGSKRAGDGSWVHSFQVVDLDGLTIDVELDAESFKELVNGWEVR